MGPLTCTTPLPSFRTPVFRSRKIEESYEPAPLRTWSVARGGLVRPVPSSTPKVEGPGRHQSGLSSDTHTNTPWDRGRVCVCRIRFFFWFREFYLAGRSDPTPTIRDSSPASHPRRDSDESPRSGEVSTQPLSSLVCSSVSSQTSRTVEGHHQASFGGIETRVVSPPWTPSPVHGRVSGPRGPQEVAVRVFPVT